MRVAKDWKQTLGEGEGAEEERGVEGIAGQGVKEEGQARRIAGDEACSGLGEAFEEGPDAEVGDEEELKGAYRGNTGYAAGGAAVADPVAEGYLEEEAGVNKGDPVVEAR